MSFTASQVIACGTATAALLLLALTLFFAQRGRWMRSLVSAAPALLVLYGFVRVLPALTAAIVALPAPGLRLAAAATLVFVPLILTRVVSNAFFREVAAVENLLIAASDSDEWSDDWRERFVVEHCDAILSSTTAIQREWLRVRNAPLGLLPWFATLFLAESRATITAYLQAHRAEPQRQLGLARRLEDEVKRAP